MSFRLRRKLLVVDVETTGLDPAKHACIELGGLLLDEELRPLDEFCSVIAPWEGAEVSAEALSVSKISTEEMHQARYLHAVIKEFDQRFCSDKSVPLLAGWNVWFDVSFLRNLYGRADTIWPFGHRFLDVQSIILLFSRLRTASQEETIQAFLREKQAHRALDDARHTAKLLRLFAEKHLGEETEESKHGASDETS